MITEAQSEYGKKYRAANKDKRRVQRKEYKAANKDKIRAQQKEWYAANRDKIRAQRKEYRAANKDKINEYLKNRRATNLNYRIAGNLRSRLYHALKGNSKTGSAVRDLGCSIDELKLKFVLLFTEGMTWENYGLWEIDHIIPLSSAQTPEDLIKLSHYSNLQPLWAADNLAKSDKILTSVEYHG